MPTVTLEEAQAKLPQIIDQLSPGEELVITRDNVRVAKLILERPVVPKPRQPGSLKDNILYIADDFDAPLEDFKEYM